MRQPWSQRLALCATMVSVAAAFAEPAKEAYEVPEGLFAGEPRGPFRTGTIEEFWIDARHDEPTTSDPTDKRHLDVQIWYPAAFKGDPQRAPYVLHRELYPTDEDTAWLDRVAHVRTNSVLGAPLAAQPARFPVLIYNPGAGATPFEATFQTEFLASHGYVVVSIGHTGFTNIGRFPDGYRYQPDRLDPHLDDEEKKGLSETQQFQLEIERFSELVMPLHVRDIRFVLDRLTVLDATRGTRFHRRLDLEHVGALGWSLGGALSLQASRDDPRILAAVNLDGSLYTDVADTGTRRPILQIHAVDEQAGWNERTPAELESARFDESLFWRMDSRTSADWYDLTVKRATHQHFADDRLFEPAVPRLMHPRLAHAIVNAYTLEFFDKYLRGRVQTPLLSGMQSYPDTGLIHKPAK